MCIGAIFAVNQLRLAQVLLNFSWKNTTRAEMKRFALISARSDA
jgi:hypothetical protein